LKLVLLHNDSLDWVAAHVDPDWIQHAAVRNIVSQRLEAQTNRTWSSLAAFLAGCESSEMQSLISEASAEERAIPNPEQQLTDVVLRLRNQSIDGQIAALTQRSSQQETGDAERS